MKKIIATNSTNWPALIARVALAITIFPHGAQKLLGWFGGYGFSGTMGYFTGTMHLPWILGFLVIIFEFFGPLFLILGIGTRIAALAVLLNFIGIIITSELHSGFFMNWSMTPNQGEGLEYFILLFGLIFIVLISGGGKASIDAALTKNPAGK